ncbi:tetratricopeptide repeat protein [Massilia brevitalea]|uniref:tetratricopeptide repeat protein n=1 Tax=Massilia brevitalea TaxID=442526 RepID=UPI002738DBB3|nr:hypothetical protein [Massilia brevitalea]
MHTLTASSSSRCRQLATLLITFTFLTACDMDKTKPPAYMQELPPFDPHIASFECHTEASKVPPIDAQADDWFLEARALEDGTTYVDDVDYKKVLRLTRQAAERHHWKAMLNLASLYLEKHDPPNGEIEAVTLVSTAIELGIPAAYDRMGTYYLNGTGVGGRYRPGLCFFPEGSRYGQSAGDDLPWRENGCRCGRSQAGLLGQHPDCDQDVRMCPRPRIRPGGTGTRIHV